MSTLLAISSRALDQSQFDRGDVSFIILAGALVFLMVPGLGFLYSGLSRRKSALTLLWAVTASNAVTIFQWYFWGYSLAFSTTGKSGYIGDLRHFALRKTVTAEPSPGSPLIPELLYSFYQMEFACVTVGILMGGLAERGRVFPAMIFSFVWMTLVYCPLACWVWNPNGWAFKFGVLDYAGGGPVEIGSGVAGLAYAWVLGRRHERELLNFRPHNVSVVGLGTLLLWFGWLGFNGGSAFGANLRAVVAVWNSMIAAATAGMTWCMLDWRLERKYTFVGLCSGTIAGLVAATPASGFIPFWAALVMGFVSGAICNFATKLKFLMRIDDALDLFAEHAMGGIIGLFFNAFFASNDIISLDGVAASQSIPGGFLDRHWAQLYIQLAYIAAVCGYTFVMTALLAVIVNRIPGCQLRATEVAEGDLGLDEDQIGEFANDYVEVRRGWDDWAPVGRDFNEAQKPAASDSIPMMQNGNGHVSAGDRHGYPETALHPHLDSVPEKNESSGSNE